MSLSHFEIYYWCDSRCLFCILSWVSLSFSDLETLIRGNKKNDFYFGSTKDLTVYAGAQDI